MNPTWFARNVSKGLLLCMAACLAGCGSTPKAGFGRSKEKQCMARVMYFESNRSSDEGMLAVGTVVMNRVKSGKYPNTICGVVGQKNQFAPGVLTKPMNDRGRERAERMADLVLSGKRHPGVRNAMFFHTAGYRFRYNNMHYVLMAGGNSFYEKRKNPTQSQDTVIRIAMARGSSSTYAARPSRTEIAAARPRPAAVRRPAPPARRTPVAPEPETLLALAPPPPAPSAEVSIEDLIVADAGFTP